MNLKVCVLFLCNSFTLVVTHFTPSSSHLGFTPFHHIISHDTLEDCLFLKNFLADIRNPTKSYGCNAEDNQGGARKAYWQNNSTSIVVSVLATWRFLAEYLGEEYGVNSMTRKWGNR